MMIIEKIVIKYMYHSTYSPLIISLSALLTEGAKQNIMFFLGASAALCTIAARLYDIYLKGQEKMRARKYEKETKADPDETENKL